MREFPKDGVARQQFVLDRVDYVAPETSGRMGGVQAGWPRWTAVWTLGNLKGETSDEWEAMLTSMRGQQRRALARDLRRPFPIAHPGGFRSMLTAGGAPFFGSASSWSSAIDADGECRLTLAGVPSGLILSPIDYVGFKWDGAGSASGAYDRRALVRVAHGGGARAAADGTITVSVEPTVPTMVPPGATAHLDRPACLMKLTPDTSIAEVDRLLKIRGSKISAVQVLEA